LFFALTVCAQRSDSTLKNLPRHYLSINPLNAALFQQVGLSYEFKPAHFGFAITAGYVYANKLNISRLFMAGTVNYGPFEYYQGLFVVPQFNFYFSKPIFGENTTLLYISLKGVYKYLFIDSTEYHIWNNTNGDYYDLYRKQVDRTHIYGGFAVFGMKRVFSHFFVDMNLGLGVLAQEHRLITVGESNSGPRQDNLSNISPPREAVVKKQNFAINFSINLGGCF
jgi:hypothetical protein